MRCSSCGDPLHANAGAETGIGGHPVCDVCAAGEACAAAMALRTPKELRALDTLREVEDALFHAFLAGECDPDLLQDVRDVIGELQGVPMKPVPGATQCTPSRDSGEQRGEEP